VHSLYVFGRQRKGSADGWPALVYFAAFFFGIMRNASFAAFAASHAFSAPFGLPAHDEVSFKIPNNSSPDPSIEHGREYVVLYLSAGEKYATPFCCGVSTGPSLFVLEAQTHFDLKSTGNISDLKNTLFEECRDLAIEFNPSVFFEEYIFFCIKDYDGTIDSYLSEHGETIAAMLKDEPIKLAQKEIDNTLATNIRYGRQDITVVDWDGAFLVDASGEFKETIAVLELANIQLLNYRILDKKLAEKIDLLKQQGEPLDLGSFFRISPLAGTGRRQAPGPWRPL
jgi:hypothetical protein